MSLRILFEQELEALKEDVSRMGECIEQVYARLFRELERKDREALKSIVESDRAVNDMRRNIEAKCLTLLLRMELPVLEQYSACMPQMIQAAKKMVCEGVEALAGRNTELAREVIACDDVVDEYFNRVKTDLIQELKEGSRNPDDCVDVLMIAKYLEKIGDHAVNIGEWTIFQETGSIQDIRLL